MNLLEMESNLQKSVMPRLAVDSSDAKYVSQLSTLLVATIEEAKDRISQIEYIFCCQLFPKVQLNYQSVQKIYSEAREAAENAYNEKEKDLLLQIKNLQCEKQQVLDENELLKLEKVNIISMEKQSSSRLNELQQELKQKNMEVNEVRETQQNLQKFLDSKSSLLHGYEKAIKELEEKNCILMKMQKKLEVETGELQLELKKKSIEVDKEKELKSQLLQRIDSSAPLMAHKDIQLKEYKEKTNELISKLEYMENKVCELQCVLGEKTEEGSKEKELQDNLMKKIEFQAAEIMNNRQLLNKYEKENKLLAARVETLMSLVEELEKELGNKPVELQEARELQQQSLQHNGSFHSERIKRKLSLDDFVEERKQFLEKQKILQEKVDELQQCVSERTKECSLQIEAKDSELRSEKNRRRDVIDAYKRLKSQYNYLLKKYNLTEETMLSAPFDKMENRTEIIMHNQTSLTSLETENNTSKAPVITSDAIKPMDEAEPSVDKKRGVSIQRSSPVSPSTSRILVAPKCTNSTKHCPPAGAKRRNSYWRDTRSHQSRVGPDPHDDFLDTPLENVRENIGKIMKEDLPEPVPRHMSLDNSDTETQDMNANAGPQTHCISPPKAGPSGFKYVEPVRKKAERENLKGIECNQCRKFYDAVLPGTGGDKKKIRCEHHNGVSRHRYRYAPPMTPEGFWNIGFESDI